MNLLPWNWACVGCGAVRGEGQTTGLGVQLKDAWVNKLDKQEAVRRTNRLLPLDTT
jgi:hypothetical protein